MATTQDDVIAELQRANAELRRERDAALAQHSSGYDERIAYQAATIDVLKAMSASPGNSQPVFDLIARQAATLCNVPTAAVAILEGTMLHLATQSGFNPAYADAYVSRFPRPVGADSSMGRAILNRQVEQVEDITADPGHSFADVLGHWSVMAVPILRDGLALGAITIGRPAMGPFSVSQIELLKTFAEQAVIAIGSAETYRALQTRTSDLQESLEYQMATSDVLKVISRSAFDLQPVLETLLSTAARLCGADGGLVTNREAEGYRNVATFATSPEYDAFFRGRLARVSRQSLTGRTVLERQIVHIHDVTSDPEYAVAESLTLAKPRTLLGVPLLREGDVVGTINLWRERVQPFTERQIELVSTFAAQAVIAIENTRLLTEQREALEQQTATTEVLQVINASPGDLGPVFDTMIEKAMRLCGAAFGSFYTYDGEQFLFAAQRGLPEAFAEFRTQTPLKPVPGSQLARAIENRRSLQVLDLKTEELYLGGNPFVRAMVDLGGVRTILTVPLCKDEAVLGFLSVYRQEVRAFSDKQIALLESFAVQAVIAMENARLLHELRARTDQLAQRQAELRVTFENMGDGVAMFDETPRLVAWNRKFQDILDLPDGVLAERLTFAEYIRYLTERGEFGLNADPDEQIRRLTENADQYRAFERVRPDGRGIEIRHNPVPGGGFVLIYADITERKRSEAEIRAARDAAEEASRTIEVAYRDLKTAQANLIQAEKMASLGQLTAGIAHEIKNPLNFVNNFAELSSDLLDELYDAVAGDRQAEIDELTATLKGNLEKITEHGKRADSIVKAMLEHSRGSSAERRMVDLNALIDEALNLAYHGARAQDQSFNIALERDFGNGIAPIEVNPQDMTRVCLNLFSNGFYAATKRARTSGDPGFVPTLKVTTRDAGDAIDIRVWDNGTGIPAEIRDKLFQPFFTTKPTGEGTGLGLSITYDIITKAHRGSIAVDSKVGEYSEFTIRLPRSP